MVINTNSAGTVSNNLASSSANLVKSSRPTVVGEDDVTISPRNGKDALDGTFSEIWDAEGAQEASDFVRRFILTDADATLRVQANLKPEKVIELLAE
ncbi:MAG: hypothetical protein FJ403_16435 [Verrucomicrobia bacterium]|nr:hypothetical protein [Verrucomicrobiota bacterium]